ncbi:MAG: zf-TFIIB domain-containing protein [Peptococcaceae bacterium]|nr:zf-TFIIB domain-containing protein [Peptococcaceae bacterium]
MNHCPSCNTTLQENTQYSIRTYVCPKCCGVWLDREQADKMLAMLQQFRLDHYELYEASCRGHFESDWYQHDRASGNSNQNAQNKPCVFEIMQAILSQ